MSSNLTEEQLFLQKLRVFVSTYIYQLKRNNDISDTYCKINDTCKDLKNNFNNNFLLKIDYIIVGQIDILSNNNFLKTYLEDYSKRYNEASRTMNHLKTSLTQKDNLYYTDLLKTGSYNPKNFDEFGLLLDPARKFMNEQKNIYDERFEYELIDLTPEQKDNLDLLLELRKRIVTKAEDLYLGEQFEYMERGLLNSDLEKIEPFKNYKTLKEESLKDAGCLIAMARDGHLFLKDLNQPYDRPKLISREELINSNKDSPILDHDNYELVDQNGKAIDQKLISSFEKNLKYLKEDLLNLELTTGTRIEKSFKPKLTLV